MRNSLIVNLYICMPCACMLCIIDSTYFFAFFDWSYCKKFCKFHEGHVIVKAVYTILKSRILPAARRSFTCICSCFLDFFIFFVLVYLDHFSCLCQQLTMFCGMPKIKPTMNVEF